MRFSFTRSQEVAVERSPVPAVPAPGIDLIERQKPNGQLQKPELLDAKVRLHRKLIDELNLSQIDKLSRPELRDQVHKLVSEYVLSERLPLNRSELDEFSDEVMDELMGLGPIEPFLKDPTVTDILIKLEPAPVRF
jgi:pilus assembly protein CpaF